MPAVDLTPFGFTPTESRVYEVLLSSGPGTGYAIARNAGLARANAYSALEGLVAKGAARVEEGRPKRFRPEPPATLLARITSDQGLALERLGQSIEGRGSAESPTLVEIGSPRGALQLLSHDIARASRSVRLLAPPEAFPILAPVLRRAVAMGLDVRLWSTGEASLPFAEVGAGIAPPRPGPGCRWSPSSMTGARYWQAGRAPKSRGTGARRRPSWPRRASPSSSWDDSR